MGGWIVWQKSNNTWEPYQGFETLQDSASEARIMQERSNRLSDANPDITRIEYACFPSDLDPRPRGIR